MNPILYRKLISNLVALRLYLATCSELNDISSGLTIAQRQIINRIYPLISGQTVVYRTDDNGTYQTGRLVNFTTLDCPNPFGTTARFTDELGTQIYANNLVCDWATMIMWYRVPKNIAATYTWNVSVDELSTLVYGGFSWRLPTNQESMSIVNAGNTGLYALNYAPFNINTTDFKNLLWCGTTQTNNSANAFCIASSGGVTPNAKTLNGDYIPCRTFTLADVGL